MKKIYLLLNYKGRFGNKYKAQPMFSAYDKTILSKCFKEQRYEVIYKYPCDIDLRSNEYKNAYILYTSIEDENCFYKNYIDDVILGLKLAGAIVIPDYQFLKAHHNKVFMEMLRDISSVNEIKSIKSKHFGALEEFINSNGLENYSGENLVIKSASGASSLGVRLAKNKKDLLKSIRKLSYSKTSLRIIIRESIRKYKYGSNFSPSTHRNKFIIQNFIVGLTGDYKILVYGNKYFIVRRPNRKNDFRASGSGKQNMAFGISANPPQGIFQFARKVYEAYDVPMISLDIAFVNSTFYLLEMQFVAFGNAGHYYSKEYFTFEGDNLIIKTNTLSIEEIYANAICDYIAKNNKIINI